MTYKQHATVLLNFYVDICKKVGKEMWVNFKYEFLIPALWLVYFALAAFVPFMLMVMFFVHGNIILSILSLALYPIEVFVYNVYNEADKRKNEELTLENMTEKMKVY